MAKEPPQFYTEKPIFMGAKNAILNCAVEGCDFVFVGPRGMFQQAWNEHWRMNHSQEIGIAYTHLAQTPTIIVRR